MDGSAVHSYRQGLERGDVDAVMASLADPVVIHVAVHDEPIAGAEPARFLFGLLADHFEDFRGLDEIADDRLAVLTFRTRLAGYRGDVEGVNLLRLDNEGLIHDLTVFLRPLAALEAVAGHIGPRMAANFGQLPRR